MLNCLIGSDAKLRQCCHLFQEGHMNIHDEECSDHPTVITNDPIDEVNEKS